MLQVERVTKRFGGVVALDQVSLSVKRGTIVSVIGPNGAGKTTLFNCITGVFPPEKGSILFQSDHRGVPLHGRASHEVARFGIARTFQNVRLFTNMSVLENVLSGTLVKTRAGFLEVLWPFGKRAIQEERWARQRAMELLAKLGLDPFALRLASALSYGEQRRLEMARALVSDPKLLLLDEPAAGLSHAEKQGLMEFLRTLKTGGLTILLIEHDMRVVMPISDWVVVLDYGEKIAEGSPKAIQEDPKVIEAYLGTGSFSGGAGS